MNSITKLKIFDVKDLLQLLRACAQNLDLANQEIPEKSLFLTSQEACRACEFLIYTLYKQCPNPKVH